jgi:hypothetical protein
MCVGAQAFQERGLVRMLALHRVIGIAGVLAIVPTAVQAQLCTGLPSHVGVEFAFAEAARGWALEFAGGDRAIGGLSYSRASPEHVDVEDPQQGLHVFAGVSVPAGSARRVFVCPVGVGGFSTGPKFDEFHNPLTMYVGGGAGVGAVAVDREVLAVVPSLRLSVTYQHVDAGAFLRTIKGTLTTLIVGVGIIFPKAHVAVRPSVNLPVDHNLNSSDFEANPTYSITVSLVE